MITGFCHKCGEKMEFDSLVGRRDDCNKCGEDVHSCYNCQHYDSTAYNECRETSADRVVEKDRSNFCDFFQLRTDREASSNSQQDLKSAAEALFKKN